MKKLATFFYVMSVVFIMAAVSMFILCGIYGSNTSDGRTFVIIGLLCIFVCVVFFLFHDYYSFLEIEKLKKQQK